MVEKKKKKGLICHKEKGLTTAQKEVLHLLTDEFLTVKQIAQRRESSLQAVYKIVAQIKKKGAFDIGFNRVKKVQSTYNKSDVRLHGQEFNIKILYQNNKYQELLEKSNVLFLDGNTIRLYKNSIEIYSGQSFFGKDANESERKSLEYFNKFFARLEHELKVNLIKKRSRNIRIVNQHYARGDSEICDNAKDENKRIWIYAEEDGKLSFITDDSFGFREDETVHPKTAKPDRKAVDKQVNDWRLNNPPTNSEIWKIASQNVTGQSFLINAIKQQQNQIQQVTNNQITFDKNFVSHLGILDKLGKGVDRLTKVVEYKDKKYKKLKQELTKLKLGDQTTLKKWF